MNLYVTTDELKTFGLSATDAKLAMLNKQATSIVNGIIGVSDFSLHKVTSEIHDSNGQLIYLRERPVIAIGKILNDDVEYSQNNEYDILSNRLKLENYLSAGSRNLKIDYAAGFNSYAMAKITVTNYANIAAAATITLGAIATDGYTITRGTDWTAGTSNDTEAENIAKAIEAKAGTSAFALRNVIYVLEATNPQITTRTIAVSDAVRLALSAATLSGVNFPEDIRLAVMLYVGNLLQIGRNPRMKSYSIGSKSVSFSSEAEFTEFKNALKPYMPVGVFAI